MVNSHKHVCLSCHLYLMNLLIFFSIDQLKLDNENYTKGATSRTTITNDKVHLTSQQIEEMIRSIDNWDYHDAINHQFSPNSNNAIDEVD